MEIKFVNALQDFATPGLLLNVLLFLNEMVNIHQFFIFGFLLLQQLYQGYIESKTNIKKHKQHMLSSTILLLFPLTQRFFFNHLTDKRDVIGAPVQVVTYVFFMVVV